MFKKTLNVFMLLCCFSFFGFIDIFSEHTNPIFFVYSVYAEEDEMDVDQECSDRLEGTMSVETCLEACTTFGYTCALAIIYKAEDEEDLTEDLDCYGCRKYVCADFGRLDAVAKTRCDTNPDKKSVPAPALLDGTPCWLCVDKKDKCSDKWAGSTNLTTCQGGCPKNTSQCVKVGNVDGTDCFRCVPKAPVPSPPKLCKDWGLLVAGQCGTCKDPTPLCVPAGVAAANGPCFQCEKKPKITCDEFGLKDKCKCAKDETLVWHKKTKVTPSGFVLRKKCCECVKKPPEQCRDISLYAKSDCKKACKKPGQCVYSATLKNGKKCYDCVSPYTCEDHGYERSCQPCTDAGLGCRGISTLDGLICKECFKEKCQDFGLEGDCKACREKGMGCRDISPPSVNLELLCKECFAGECPQDGLPGDCPGTCYDGELCITQPGPCHICMKPKSVRVTRIIIIIETPYGRVILDDGNMELTRFTPNSLMALANYDESMGSFESLGVGSLAKGSDEEIAQKLKAQFENSKSKFSAKCFDEFDQKDIQRTPPEEDEQGVSSNFGYTDRDDIPITGPVITCGNVKGKATLVIFDASGVFIAKIIKSDLKENPNIILEALQKAGDESISSINRAIETQVDNIDTRSLARAYEPKKKKKKKKKKGEEEVIIEPNDPLFYQPKQKKKKLFGILGSSCRIQ